MSLSFTNYTTAILALLALNLAGIGLGIPLLAAPAAALLVLLQALAVGAAAFPKQEPVQRGAYGLAVLVCWYATAGAIVYALGDLSASAVFTLWLATNAGAAALALRAKKLVGIGKGGMLPRTPLIDVVLTAIVALSAFAAAVMLAMGRTQDAIQSPWQAVSPAFFVALFAAAVALVALLARGRTRAGLPAAVLVAALALSAAVAVYGIGYGYDPFIHQKAEETILSQGVIHPKTPYYLGQYALVTIAARVSLLPYLALDRALVPFGFALLLPLLAAAFARTLLPRAPWRIAVLAPLLVPFGAYISTTPTGLAYLFAALGAFGVAAWRAGALPPHLMLAGTLAALATHPLVGIPTAGLALIAAADAARKEHAFTVRAIGEVLIIFGVPVAFLLNALRGGTVPVWTDAPLAVVRGLADAWPRFAPTGELPLDLPYLWRAVVPALLVAAALIAWRINDGKRRRTFTPIVTAALLLLPAYAGLGLLRFPEAGDVGAAAFPFRARLLELAAVFLLPAVSVGLVAAYEKLARAPLARLTASGVLAAALVASVYVSYPRLDRIEPSKGYAVSASTVAAVHWIARACHGPYVVLGNQTVAAAAIRELGFVSFPGIPFAYANESGAPELNDFFLKMNNTPTRTTALEAMDANGVDELFFVVNDFWKNSARIAETAAQEADDVIDVDGKVTVFVYRR
ncbi:hypothetical protein EPO33_02510 [Patescibacteria group bacterium]|nr:MAG: hypothetical protein EPO33_02510 [Patescibacteria group bacterium]